MIPLIDFESLTNFSFFAYSFSRNEIEFLFLYFPYACKMFCLNKESVPIGTDFLNPGS